MAYESGHIYLVDVEPTGASLAQYSFPVGFRVCNAATNTNYEVTYDKEGRRYLEDSEIIEGIIAIGNVTRNENTFTIGVHPSGMNKWRIKGQTYATSSASNITIPAAQPGLYRIDYIVATTGGGLQLLKGEEAKFPIEPNIYNYNFVKVFSVLVTPDGISISGEDTVLSMGIIETSTNWIGVNVHNSGSNKVRIGGTIYYKNTISEFYYTAVSNANLKSLIIYALPTAQMLYLAEGNEGLEAVEPEIPAGALVVKKMIASRDGSWDVYDSLADAFIKKTTQAWRNRVFNTSDTDFIVIDKGLYANFRIQSATGISEINIGGINDRTNGALYDGLPMFLKNETNKPVNFLESYATPTQGRNITFVASQLPFVLQPGLTVELRYNPSNNKLDILKFNSAGGDDYAKKDGSNIALPAFRDNLNIQVSATNLAKNSKGLIDSNSYWVRDVAVSKVLESGKTYTVKVWTKTVNQNTSAYFSIGDQTGHLVNLTKISPTEFVGKVVMPRDSNGNLVLFRQPNDSSFYQFEAIKIVEGDMITKDWSPSPDDAAAISFAAEGEVEGNTPPSSENNKAISLFGLWKWWAKRKLEVLLKNFTEDTTIATNGQLFSITGLSDKSADSTYYKILAQDSSGKVATIDNVSRRYDGTFNPPTQAQLTSLGLRRGDYYQCTTTMQRAIYNGNQLIEWTVTTSEFNALSTDQKNAIKNLSIVI